MSVGLDIGSKTIKAVELAKEGGKFALKSAGAVGFSGMNIDQMASDKDYAQIAPIIKKLMNDARISSKNVSISLPETQVFTRVMKFPMLNEQEIASAVKWEAEEYIPIPVQDAVIEHQILEKQETSNPPQILVLLIAALKELVEKYVKVVNAAGLNVVSVETELISMVRSLAPANKTILLIDFGAHSTDIAIAKNQQLFFSRSIPTAGDAFTRAVAQALGVSPEQAEQYKRTYGLSEGQLEGKVGRALSPIIKVVTEEIKKAVHYYQIELKGTPPTNIILSGGTAGLPGIAPAFTKALGIEVEIANPFTQIQIDPESAKNLANYSPLYSVAAGLAMRGD